MGNSESAESYPVIHQPGERGIAHQIVDFSVSKLLTHSVDGLLDAEISLVSRLGWIVSLNKSSRKKWLNS